MRTAVMQDDIGLFTGPAAYQVLETLEAIIAAVGAEPTTVMVGGPITAASSLTVPSNLTLHFVSNGRLTVAAGCTVTVQGAILAPPMQIFFGSGVVTVANTDCLLYLGWWGSTGARFGSVACTDIHATNASLTNVQSTAVSTSVLVANGISATGAISVTGSVTAAEFWEGSLRVGSDKVSKAGDVMTGQLVLMLPPISRNDAANRGYVEDVFAALQASVGSTNGFGILVINGSAVIEATAPMSSFGLSSGYGTLITQQQYPKFTDAGEFAFTDLGAVAFSDDNAIVVSTRVAAAAATLTATDQISCSTPTVRVEGDGGAVVLTSNPQVTAGLFDGQTLQIVGSSDTNTITLSDGSGISLAGGAAAVLGAGDSICLRWDLLDTTWREVWRAIL